MNGDHRDDSVPGLDALRKTYRAARFEDEPPPHVDTFIRAATKRADRRRLRAYLPPLAMVATIVLALGLVLRLTSLGPEDIEQAPELTQQLAPRAVKPAEPEAAGEQAVAPELDTTASTDLAPLLDTDASARAIGLRRDSADAGRASTTAEEPSAPDRDSPAPASVAPAVSPAARSRSVDDQRAQEGVASTAVSTALDQVTVQARSVPVCAELQSEPETWLACIAAAVDAGELDAARTELEAFRRGFPDYVVPEPLTTALAP